MTVGQTRVGHREGDRGEWDVYIGRKEGGERTIRGAKPGECWGNPFRLEDHSRRASIKRFAALLNDLVEEQPVYRLHLHRLAGKTLACWCREVDQGEPACHGDVLAASADHWHERYRSGGRCNRGAHEWVQYRDWFECVECGISGQSAASGGRRVDVLGDDPRGPAV